MLAALSKLSTLVRADTISYCFTDCNAYSTIPVRTRPGEYFEERTGMKRIDTIAAVVLNGLPCRGVDICGANPNQSVAPPARSEKRGISRLYKNTLASNKHWLRLGGGERIEIQFPRSASQELT